MNAEKKLEVCDKFSKVPSVGRDIVTICYLECRS